MKKMYNNKKVCVCGWIAKYDSNRDTFNIGNYKYCPMCAKKLEIKGYSPL